MSIFIKGFAKIKEDKVCLFSELHVFSKFVNEHDELCLAGSLFLEPVLQFKENVLVCEVFGDPRSHNMLKHLTEDTYQGNWSVICWVSFIPFFEYRGYVCLFPDGWVFTCVKGFLIH